MKLCKTCGTKLPDDAEFCFICGGKAENPDMMKAPIDFDDTEETSVLNDNSIDEETTVLNDNNPYQNMYAQPHVQQQSPVQAYPNPMQNGYPNTQFTFEQFFDRFASNKTKGYVKWLGIIAIVTAVLSLVNIFAGNYVGVIDLIFYGVFSFLLLKNKNWAFPLIVTCYSGTFTIITVALGGTPSGIVALILGILSTVKMKKITDLYKVYKTSGQFPNEQI